MLSSLKKPSDSKNLLENVYFKRESEDKSWEFNCITSFGFSLVDLVTDIVNYE